MDTRQEVKIKYRTEMFTFCRREAGSGGFLTDIEVLDEKANRPMEILVDKTIPTTVAPKEKHNTREEKIFKLLKLQQVLIEELSKEN